MYSLTCLSSECQLLKEHNYSGSNQLASVEITGFAFFYLSEPMNWQDKTIKGEFIQRADTGFFEEGTTNTGAYAIRLTQ